MSIDVAAETVLCLRSCAADMTSYNGFTWPREGEVVAPDWDPAPRCGGGLHGLLWGEGDGHLMRWEEDAVWLVFAADAATVVDLGDKVKVPRATVVMVGERVAVAAWLSERAPGRAVVSGTATAGDSGTATAGYRGTATAGDSGTATAGYRGTATAGYRGTATAGYSGTATAGYRGTATAGDSGTATAGVSGTATAGVSGTATAGYRGTATAGVSGTATAGEEGAIAIQRWNGKRYRWTLGEIGETGDVAGDPLAAGVAYRLDAEGAFVRAEERP